MDLCNDVWKGSNFFQSFLERVVSIDTACVLVCYESSISMLSCVHIFKLDILKEFAKILFYHNQRFSASGFAGRLPEIISPVLKHFCYGCGLTVRFSLGLDLGFSVGLGLDLV